MEQLAASLAYLVLQLAVFFCPFACRRILAPGEEENLEFEEDEEEGGAGPGSPDSFPARVPGGYRLSADVRRVTWSRSGVGDASRCSRAGGSSSPGLCRSGAGSVAVFWQQWLLEKRGLKAAHGPRRGSTLTLADAPGGPGTWVSSLSPSCSVTTREHRAASEGEGARVRKPAAASRSLSPTLTHCTV